MWSGSGYWQNCGEEMKVLLVLLLCLPINTNPFRQNVVDPIKDYNAFAITLLSSLKSEDNNVFISPFVVYSNLSLMAVTSEGVFSPEVRKALHLEGENEGILKRLINLDYDKKPGDFEARSVLLLNAGRTRTKNLESWASEYSRCDLLTLKEDEDTGAAINRWAGTVSDEGRRGRFKADKTIQGTREGVVSLVSFRCHWNNHFGIESTTEGKFYGAKAERNFVSLMTATAESQKSFLRPPREIISIFIAIISSIDARRIPSISLIGRINLSV